MCLLVVWGGLCWTWYVLPVRSCALLRVSVHFREISMRPNSPLLEFFCQSRAILCVRHGLKSDFVVYLSILCVLNVIALNPPYLEVRYSYKWALECPIIYYVSLLIGIWMPYYVYHKSPIWHLNEISYWK